MSTNGMTSWAVDLKDVGAIYPFQGWETVLIILGLAFWIGWHVWQIRHENAELASEKKRGTGDKARKFIDRYQQSDNFECGALQSKAAPRFISRTPGKNSVSMALLLR